METSDKIAILEGAAEFLEENGWLRFRLSNDEGTEACVVGAVSYAGHQHLGVVEEYEPMLFYSCPEWGELLREMDEYAKQEIPGSTAMGLSAIVQFNNVVAEDKYEVIDHLRRMAKNYHNSGAITG